MRSISFVLGVLLAIYPSTGTMAQEKPLRRAPARNPGRPTAVSRPSHWIASDTLVSVLFDEAERSLRTATHSRGSGRSLLATLAEARKLAEAKATADAVARLDRLIAQTRRGTAALRRAAAPIATVRAHLAKKADNPVCPAPRLWRQSFADEFNGAEIGNEACYDQNVTPVQCQEPYWATSPCPTYHPGLDGLNKCRWAVMGMTNWMTNGLPVVNAFTEKEVAVSGGQLILSAHAQPGPYDCGNPVSLGISTKQCPILSGGVWGNEMGAVQGFHQLRGRFEVRARLPYGAGSWPAHWLLPHVGAWPDAGEIDIMEAVGWKPTSIGGNYHDGGPVGGGNTLVTSKGKDFDAGNDAFASEYHVFAIEWDAQRIDYYVDGICYHSVLAGESVVGDIWGPGGNVVGTAAATLHVPTTSFHWILNQTVANMNAMVGDPANPDPANFTPQLHYIDYVRVYEECTGGDPDCGRVPNQVFWSWLWGNGGSGKVALWNMAPGDRWLAGDFEGDGRDDLLAIAAAGWAHVMEWGGADWAWQWGNAGSGQIALWKMNLGDQFVTGDFDGDGADELLAFSLSGWSHLMDFTASAWQWRWGNGGSGQIALWKMNPGDVFVAGDFDGDGTDEVLAVAQNGWAHVFEWNGSDWSWRWGNGGSGQIALWHMNPGDRYFAGDFDGDGTAEVLAVAQNGWAQLMRFGAGGWTWIWGNGGNGRIQLRPMDVADGFVPGNFYGTGSDALFVGDVNGSPLRSYLVRHEALGTWQWMREDVGQMALWIFNPDDRFLSGDFRGVGHDELFAIATNGWAQLMALGSP